MEPRVYGVEKSKGVVCERANRRAERGDILIRDRVVPHPDEVDRIPSAASHAVSANVLENANNSCACVNAY